MTVSFLHCSLPTEQPEQGKPPTARLGIGLLAWSHDSRYLASRCDASSTVLWVWDCSMLQLVAVVQFARPILQVRYVHA